MSHAPNWVPSKRLQAAAKSERKRIDREIERLRKQEVRHRRELAQIEARRARLEAELVAVDRFTSDESADSGSHLQIVETKSQGSGRTALRGAQIREFAVQLIVNTEQARGGIHYRTWFELVASNGIQITGKDPLATFLTQMSRSPVVVKTERPGEYVIDDSFPERAAREIVELNKHIEFLGSPDPGLGISDIEQNRNMAKQARSRKRSLERALKEARRSLRTI